MNAQNRKALSAINADVCAARELIAEHSERITSDESERFTHEQATEIAGKIDDCRSRIESERDEEQDKYDNMPEGLQGGEKGDRSQSQIDALESALDDLESSVNDMEQLATDLEAGKLNDRMGILEFFESTTERLENAESSIDDAINA